MRHSKILAFTALSALLMAGPALADTSQDTKTESSVQTKDNGGYVEKNSTTSTDAAGTTHEQDKTKKVTVDSNGNKTSKVDIQTSTDPKGLFNKTTTETKDTTTEKNGGVSYDHAKTVNGKTVEEDSQTKSAQ
jgi:hypothetical protein